MKVIVCIKQVPDTETKIKIKGDGSGIDTAGIKWVMNPYDEFAVEEAIKMRETGKATQVVVVSVGPKLRVVESLRTALAMGADEAIVVDASEEADSATVVNALAAVVKAEGDFKAVLTGKLSIDDNLASVGPQLAQKLGIAATTVVSKLEIGEVAIAEREVEGGTREICQLTGPFLVAANKGLNMPRYASLPGIMKAKKKVIKELTLDGLGLKLEVKMKQTAFQLPPEKPPVQLISGDSGAQVKSLVQLLRNEAKVL